jgi:hypothetical protein
MNGYVEYDGEGLAVEDYPEADYEGWEPGEAPARFRRPAPARPGPYTRPQPQANQGYVTHAVLNSRLAEVRRDMQKNATAISAVGRQIDTLSTRTRKDIEGLRGDLRRSTEMGAMLPLLTQPGSRTVAQAQDSGDQILPAGTQVAVSSDGFASLLPFLLLSGTFTGSSGGQQQQGAQDNSMLMLVLAMTMLRK